MGKLRGFAAMDKERLAEISRSGGKAVPRELRTFCRDTKLASEAGKKGGHALSDEKRYFARYPHAAVACGKLGGKAVPHHLRAFYQDRQLASAAGKKGGRKARTKRPIEDLSDTELETAQSPI